MIDKILSLINSGTKENIELAYQISIGQKLNFKRIVLNIYGELLTLRCGEDNVKYMSNEILVKELTALHKTTSYNLVYKTDELLHKITKFPKNLHLLKNIDLINLSDTRIKTIPIEFLKITKLDRIGLCCTEVTDISILFKHPNLKGIFMEGCNITDLPEIEATNNSITYIDLSNNKINDVPKSFDKLMKLETLDVRYNNMNPQKFKEAQQYLESKLKKFIKLNDDYETYRHIQYFGGSIFVS